ncbi:DUF5682 family protein [Planctomicrobium sp. SH527]|uniref:DUF5682 family protein n=1 Tax=Planctomicrobium sp. SH527 TaxID=3448123 RepID=UPI003F5BC28E
MNSASSTPVVSSPIHVFGIRHHGPGCARRLREALDELQPDAIVLEAPADVADVLHLAGCADIRPPVAMIIYPQDNPRLSTVFPLATFSPEWQAVTWGVSRGVPVVPMDLPMFHRLPLDCPVPVEAIPTDLPESLDRVETGEQEQPQQPEPASGRTSPKWRVDPLALLAEAAGYHDHELWWEELIERRRDATGLFGAILNAMRAIREECPEASERDLLREAFMRKTIRGVLKSGAKRIAVVCGAWHAPVLDEAAITGKRDGCKVKQDQERLRKLPKTKTIATWIPWSHARLAYRSGYGAGVESPGWYAHLWESSDEAPTRWLVDAARLLREQDLGASSASIIEARRLADALAAVRDRRAPGLQELNEAIQTVLCHGDEAPLRLIRRRLELGDRLGTVPAEAPSVPLDRDLKRLQTSLRMKPGVQAKILDLDLRSENGRERSWLLHRLNLLGIHWGTLTGDSSDTSTFHEIWKLVWEPEFSINIIEANIWGNTVLEAATNKVLDVARTSVDLLALTRVLDSVLMAALPDAVPAVMQKIQATAAVATDVLHLMSAVPPLVRVSRYGDVRKTAASGLEPILVGMVERIVTGLPASCSSVDDEAAEQMIGALAQMQGALELLNRPDLMDDWRGRIRWLSEGNIHGLIRGWCVRNLLEQGLIDVPELERLTHLALSRSVNPGAAAAWISGLLKGSGLLLLHQDALWGVMDRWLCELSEEVFLETLPLLRRAFSDFSPAERRQMGAKLKRLNPASPTSASLQLDEERKINDVRAALVLPVLAQILGGSHHA